MKFLIILSVVLMSALARAEVANVPLNTANYHDYANVQRPVTFVGIVKIKADQVDVFVKIATSFLGAMRAQKGNLSYNIVQSLSDPTQFIWIEDWKNGKSLENHMDSKAVADLVAKVGPLFETPLRILVTEKR